MPLAIRGRTAVLAAPAAALLLLATAAAAQTTAPAPAAGAESQPPLMTAPRPEDTPTTDPTASPSGIGGSAPSDEMQRMAPTGTAAAPGRPPGHSMTAAEAHALIGKPVQTRDGQTAGEIRDFTLAGPDGRIDRLVLASGGFLGVGTKLVSVPVTTLRAASADAALTLDLDTGDLAVAPEFDYKQGERTLVGKP